MVPDHFPDIYVKAIKASIAASEAVMKVYASDIEVQLKEDASPVTIADITSSRIINDCLSNIGIPIIDEETISQDFSIRSRWKENWCVDPLDGTKMFIQKNGEFSINIAHVVEGKSIFGIIACPVERTVLIGGKDFGAFIFSFEDLEEPKKWKSINPPLVHEDSLTVICSRSFDKDDESLFEARWKNKSKISYIKKGSALKFFDLALGKVNIYPRFAPTMEWDIAAGQAIIEALGGEVVDYETDKPLQYNKENLYNPYFIVKTNALL